MKVGDKVVYVPIHALGNRLHRDCESGMVSSISQSGVFVKFNDSVSKLGWDGATAQLCRVEDLVLE